MSDNTARVQGASPLFILFIVFLVLKLTNYITWSWWLVTAPLWAPVAILIAILVGAFAIGVVSAALRR